MIGAKRRERAIRLRDLALALLKVKGDWRPLEAGDFDEVNVLHYQSEDLRIVYRTPFQVLPGSGLTDEMKYFAAQRITTDRYDLPYGIDIWCPEKVLNIIWADDGLVSLDTYKPGAWEQQLEAETAALPK
jgi:hypothetical protein